MRKECRKEFADRCVRVVEVAGRCIRESHSQGCRAYVCRQHAPPMVAETLLPHL